jgi:hypothetical protein
MWEIIHLREFLRLLLVRRISGDHACGFFP